MTGDQGSLFGNPIVHTNDPATSRESAQRVERTGRRSRHVHIIVGLVTAHPGSTACELWEKAAPDTRRELKEMQEIRRRLTDAVEVELVVRGPARVCAVRGTKQSTWTVARG